MAVTTQTQRDVRLEILKLKTPPSLPAIAQQLLKSLSQEDIDIPDLADDIEKCPGLTARILGLANSAYFGCRRTLYTVSDATVVIGLNMVRSVGLAMVLSDPLNTKSCPAF
ncbi:MAG: HDOD domain-containing protein, partial [Candidatus Tectomicrobia bacterium]